MNKNSKEKQFQIQISNALIGKDKEKIKKLIENDRNHIRLQEKNGYNIIHRAVSQNDLELLEFICEILTPVEIKELIDQGDDEGFRPIHISIFNHNKDVFEFLVTKGADMTVKSNTGIDLMLMNAQDGNVEMLKRLLLEKTLNINIKDKHENTYLHYASKYGNIEAIKYLLEINKTIPINIVNQSSHTPLHLAYISGK
jgi:ankyrin repeat protein